MKVNIELRPYNALEILRFCREWINDDTPNDYHFTAIKEAVQELEDEVYKKLTNEHLDEIDSENAVNKLIGKSPQ